MKNKTYITINNKDSSSRRYNRRRFYCPRACSTCYFNDPNRTEDVGGSFGYITDRGGYRSFGFGWCNYYDCWCKNDAPCKNWQKR